jgi:hypothetical protein
LKIYESGVKMVSLIVIFCKYFCRSTTLISPPFLSPKTHASFPPFAWAAALGASLFDEIDELPSTKKFFVDVRAELSGE